MKILKRVGTLTGIIGALLIASNLDVTGWGFVAFFISSACWFIVSMKMKEPDLAVLQFVFLCINIIGIVRWLI